MGEIFLPVLQQQIQEWQVILNQLHQPRRNVRNMNSCLSYEIFRLVAFLIVCYFPHNSLDTCLFSVVASIARENGGRYVSNHETRRHLRLHPVWGKNARQTYRSRSGNESRGSVCMQLHLLLHAYLFINFCTSHVLCVLLHICFLIFAPRMSCV